MASTKSVRKKRIGVRQKRTVQGDGLLGTFFEYPCKRFSIIALLHLVRRPFRRNQGPYMQPAIPRIRSIRAEVKGVIDNGFFPPNRNDYCKMIEE